MRIAFDGRSLTSPAAGIRRYAAELFDAMSHVAPDIELIAIGAESHASRPRNVRRVVAHSWLPTNLGWNLAALPLALRRLSVDLFHAPAYVAPLWGARPLVVTLHDVSYARHPEWYPYRSDTLRQAFYRASALAADRILTDSSFSRDEIVAAYGIEPARIDVVPLGIGPQFAPARDVQREPFVLHVGDLHRRRNLTMLLDIVLALRRSNPRFAALRLVLAGNDLGSLEELRRRITGVEDALEYVGRPPDNQLIDLYRRAAVFAYPSCYEGFGLPPLEAMACGAPVIAARAGSLPEVLGAAAVLVPPTDVNAWYEAVRVMLTDRERTAELEVKGPAHAARFLWERTAAETLACYRRAIEDYRRGAA